MKIPARNTRGHVLAATMALAGILSLCACSPQASSNDNAAQPTSNDTVVLGELDAYDPSVEHEAEEGTSLGFDEESQLQQEKTAGASGGAVQSNLDPLEPGCTAYSEGESTVGFKAATGEPATVPHSSSNGTECLSCHTEGEHKIPASHESAAIGNAQCVTCHEVDFD